MNPTSPAVNPPPAPSTNPGEGAFAEHASKDHAMTRATRFGYFGPAGTFTQMALLQWQGASGGEHTAYPSVDATLAAVRTGAVDAGMVPIENSVEGGVSATLDALASGDPLVVIGEVIVPITFVVAARAPMELAQIRTIGTHSHAWAQVRGWVAAHTPNAAYVPTLSTASCRSRSWRAWHSRRRRLRPDRRIECRADDSWARCRRHPGGKDPVRPRRAPHRTSAALRRRQDDGRPVPTHGSRRGLAWVA